MLMMFPFEAPTIFEGIHKSYFRMPRVVKDQKNKFENDDLFRQLSHESAVKYTGFKDRPLEERQMKFVTNCQEGHTEVSVVQSGIQFTLMFNPAANPAYNNEGCDFNKELGKVHIKAGFILNGVCVLWRGWVDLQRLEGFGCLEFDEYRAYLEDAMLKQQLDKQQACNNNNNINRTNHQTSPLGHHHNNNNHHHNHLAHLDAANVAAAAAAAAANQRLSSSAAAAAAAAAAIGLNPACLGGPNSLGNNTNHPLGHHQTPPASLQVPPQSAPLSQHHAPLVPPPPHQASLQTAPPPPAPQTHTHASAQQLPQSQTAPVTLADTSSYYGNAAIAAAAAAAFHQAFGVGVGGGGPGIQSSPSSQQHHHQAVRNLQRFSSGPSLAAAAGGAGGLQTAPKVELQ